MNDKATDLLIDLMYEKLQSKDKEIAEMRTMLCKQDSLIRFWMQKDPTYLPLATSCKCGDLYSKYCLCDVSTR